MDEYTLRKNPRPCFHKKAGKHGIRYGASAHHVSATLRSSFALGETSNVTNPVIRAHSLVDGPVSSVSSRRNKNGNDADCSSEIENKIANKGLECSIHDAVPISSHISRFVTGAFPSAGKAGLWDIKRTVNRAVYNNGDVVDDDHDDDDGVCGDIDSDNSVDNNYKDIVKSVVIQADTRFGCREFNSRIGSATDAAKKAKARAEARMVDPSAWMEELEKSVGKPLGKSKRRKLKKKAIAAASEVAAARAAAAENENDGKNDEPSIVKGRSGWRIKERRARGKKGTRWNPHANPNSNHAFDDHDCDSAIPSVAIVVDSYRCGIPTDKRLYLGCDGANYHNHWRRDERNLVRTRRINDAIAMQGLKKL